MISTTAKCSIRRWARALCLMLVPGSMPLQGDVEVSGLRADISFRSGVGRLRPSGLI